MPARVALGKPISIDGYKHFNVSGVDIYLDTSLVMTGPQAIVGLGGFWKFRWLNVWGLEALTACTI